jgi:hypothetical protein
MDSGSVRWGQYPQRSWPAGQRRKTWHRRPDPTGASHFRRLTVPSGSGQTTAGMPVPPPEPPCIQNWLARPFRGGSSLGILCPWGQTGALAKAGRPVGSHPARPNLGNDEHRRPNVERRSQRRHRRRRCRRAPLQRWAFGVRRFNVRLGKALARAIREPPTNANERELAQRVAVAMAKRGQGSVPACSGGPQLLAHSRGFVSIRGSSVHSPG